MAVKKSQLYNTIWESCNKLRGGMDASQYKDYVLSMLFLKYISDKYADIPFSTIKVPTGSSFKDMLALRNNSKSLFGIFLFFQLLLFFANIANIKLILIFKR